MARFSTPLIALGGCVAGVSLLASGCGSAPQSSQRISLPAGQSVSITTQPTSATVPADQSVTFTVVATGSEPISYQWTENGAPIQGATSSTYTVPDVSFGDSGETFAVTVSNDLNSVMSMKAVLTVGARSPEAGDLRFQQVDAPSIADQGTGPSVLVRFMDNMSGYYGERTVSPLEMENDNCAPAIPYDCDWAVLFTSLPTGQTGLTSYYYGGDYASLASDVSGGGVGYAQTMASPDSVITSLDLQPANLAYAVTWMTTDQTKNFDLRREAVALDAVASTVAADAVESRVVTAVSIDDSTGQVNLISYGWQGDITTIYDTDVVLAGPTIPEIESAANAMAQQGYIITAFGGNFTDGFLLVGTKVHGDTLPRPILIFDQNVSPPSPQDGSSTSTNGYAPVASAVYYPNPGNTQYVWVYER